MGKRARKRREARRQSRLDRIDARQSARSERASGRQDTKQEMIKQGINPNQFASDALNLGGSILQNKLGVNPADSSDNKKLESDMPSWLIPVGLGVVGLLVVPKLMGK